MHPRLLIFPSEHEAVYVLFRFCEMFYYWDFHHYCGERIWLWTFSPVLHVVLEPSFLSAVLSWNFPFPSSPQQPFPQVLLKEPRDSVCFSLQIPILCLSLASGGSQVSSKAALLPSALLKPWYRGQKHGSTAQAHPTGLSVWVENVVELWPDWQWESGIRNKRFRCKSDLKEQFVFHWTTLKANATDKSELSLSEC